MILAAVIIFLLLAVVFLSLKLYFYNQENIRLQKELMAQTTNIKVLNFAKLFVGKVLAVKEEVDFESRLKMENAIRDINDAELFDQWTKFTKSDNPDEAQQNVVILLQMLVSKISVNQ